MSQLILPVIINKDNRSEKIIINQSTEWHAERDKFEKNPDIRKIFSVLWKMYLDTRLSVQSWLGNPRCAAVASKLYKNPSVLYWVGEYSRMWTRLYDEECECAFTEEESEFDVTGRFAVNHTKKACFCMSDVQKCDNGKQIFALAYLTAYDKSLDFDEYTIRHAPGLELVGTWAGDVISVEDEAPQGYELLHIPFEDHVWDVMDSYDYADEKPRRRKKTKTSETTNE